LALDQKGPFNPRLAFGSHDDSDHVYNTPRAWYMGRYFNPRTIRWEGPEAEYTPESDDIPWALVPEHKITVEEVKYILSSHFQGTPYDPYGKVAAPEKGKYRPIGISRTAFMSIAQIRGDLPKEFAAIEWICFASNAFNALVPFYSNTDAVPAYYGGTTMEVSTDAFYWSSRLLGALADAHFGLCGILIERYQDAVANEASALIHRYDKAFAQSTDLSKDIISANEAIAAMAKRETEKALDAVLYTASCAMKNGYSRSDN
jgi:dipeptidase